MVGTGLGTVLGNTQVFYMALFGVLFFGERLTLNLIVSMALAVTGVALLVSINIPGGMSSEIFYIGAACGIATGIAYAIYMLLLRRLELAFPEVTSLQKLFWVYLYSSLVLFSISAFTGEIAMPSYEDVLWILLLGIVVSIIGWKLISSNLLKVKAATVGVVLLIQPAGATIWGVLFFLKR